MKLKKALYLFVLLTLSAACVQEKKEETIETEMEEKTVEQKRLRHMVIFKFNDDSSPEDVDRLNKSFIGAKPPAISPYSVAYPTLISLLLPVVRTKCPNLLDNAMSKFPRMRA